VAIELQAQRARFLNRGFSESNLNKNIRWRLGLEFCKRANQMHNEIEKVLKSLKGILNLGLSILASMYYKIGLQCILSKLKLIAKKLKDLQNPKV
jgi:hypothetical protein